MGIALREDALKRGICVRTSRFNNRPFVVLDRPIDGLVHLLDITTKQIVCTTVWGMGIASRRVGAGNRRHSTRLVPLPLCLSDLKPGKHIEVRDKPSGQRLYHGLVKGVINDSQPMVMLHDEVHHRDMTMFAADMGLVPYASGRRSDRQVTYAFGQHRVDDLLRPDQTIPDLVTV